MGKKNLGKRNTETEKVAVKNGKIGKMGSDTIFLWGAQANGVEIKGIKPFVPTSLPKADRRSAGLGGRCVREYSSTLSSLVGISGVIA
ncbi:MAG: hypothetical protein AAB507_00035 [Patescibacteria group bacterium]